MEKEAKNGIYTTGKASFRISILNKKVVEIDAIDEVPELRLKVGEKTKMNKEAFDVFLNEDLQHYFWHKP